MAILLGCCHEPEMNEHNRITFVFDSKFTLGSLEQYRHSLALTMRVQMSPRNLSTLVSELHLWRATYHIDLIGNDLPRDWTKSSPPASTHTFGFESFPANKTILANLILRTNGMHLRREAAYLTSMPIAFSIALMSSFPVRN